MKINFNGKKSSKFWQVIVNYDRFVGFKEQLGCLNFVESVRQFFMKMCVFWAKHKIFKLNVEDFPPIQIFFFLKSLRRVQIC
jgi:hypothetical protein